jgi:fatty acid desaturase
MKMIFALSRVTRIRNIAEHASTSTGEGPFSHAPIRSSGFAPYWVNYHAEHHLFTYLPCYRLPEAHRLLDEKALIA